MAPILSRNESMMHPHFGKINHPDSHQRADAVVVFGPI
jgi:hypothetical protein